MPVYCILHSLVCHSRNRRLSLVDGCSPPADTAAVVGSLLLLDCHILYHSHPEAGLQLDLYMEIPQNMPGQERLIIYKPLFWL